MSSLYAILFHKELNMFNCFCGYFGLNHHCTQKIRGTINIAACPEDCSLCKKEAERKEYISLSSKHSSWWRRLEDVFRLLLRKTSSRRLQDVLINTNIFLWIIRLQKTSSRRLGQDQYIRLVHTSSRRLQDVFKTSSRHLQDVLPRCLQDVFKTSSRLLANTSWRHLQDVLKTSWKRLEDVLKR